MFLKTNDEEINRKDSNFLLEKLAQVYAKDIRSLNPIIEDVIFTVDDSNSWRKDLYLSKDYKGLTRMMSLEDRTSTWFHDNKPNRDTVDAFDKLSDEDKTKKLNDLGISKVSNKVLKYKGTRKKDDSIDFSLIFKTFEGFLKGLAISSGVKFKAIPGCEADDLMFVCASYLNSIGKSVVIYSGDGDLVQTVGFDKSKNTFTIQYQKQNRKIWIDRETALFLKQNSKSHSVDCIRSVVGNTSSKLTVANPFEVVLGKVLGGDISDNIFSVIVEPRQYKTGIRKGQWKECKVSDSIIKKILEEIESTKYNVEDLFRSEFRKKLASATIRNFKSQNIYNLDEVENNVDTNTTLVLLHKDTIPTDLYEAIFDWCEVVTQKKKCDLKKQFNYKSILENTPMYDKKAHDNASSASIFKEMGL
tara:strand:+ start:58 stop:1305 length:1248 start_codon:yes stop_codon:yes gene_type:complete